MVPKPAASASEATRSMTASPWGPTGASGLQPPYRLARPAARMTSAGSARGRLLAHVLQRKTALAQVMPPPKPVRRRWSPSWTRPASMASLRASGMEADEVLP